MTEVSSSVVVGGNAGHLSAGCSLFVCADGCSCEYTLNILSILNLNTKHSTEICCNGILQKTQSDCMLLVEYLKHK